MKARKAKEMSTTGKGKGGVEGKEKKGRLYSLNFGQLFLFVCCINVVPTKFIVMNCCYHIFWQQISIRLKKDL